jgi:TM2 domain-containing membrane protein YozV
VSAPPGAAYPPPPGAYPVQPYGQPQYVAPTPGYPAPYAQPVIVVQNQINPYGAMMHPNPLKKDTALILAVIGIFFGFSGLQRFYTRQWGLGILYFFTGGLCLIGQIIDIVQLASMSQQEFDMKYNVLRPGG